MLKPQAILLAQKQYSSLKYLNFVDKFTKYPIDRIKRFILTKLYL